MLDVALINIKLHEISMALFLGLYNLERTKNHVHLELF